MCFSALAKMHFMKHVFLLPKTESKRGHLKNRKVVCMSQSKWYHLLSVKPKATIKPSCEVILNDQTSTTSSFYLFLNDWLCANYTLLFTSKFHGYYFWFKESNPVILSTYCTGFTVLEERYFLLSFHEEDTPCCLGTEFSFFLISSGDVSIRKKIK